MFEDRDLVCATLDGTKEAFDNLVRKYTGSIYALCISKVGPVKDAEDLVQETFLRAFRNLKSLNEPNKFGSWIYGIALNICFDWIRKSKRDQNLLRKVDPKESVPEIDTPQGRVLEMIKKLPDDYKEAIMFYYFERKSYEEMAKILGVSKATINFRLTKARTMLRSSFKE